MTTVSVKDGKNRFSELVREAEKGKVVTVTRNGTPVCEITPLTKKKGGIDWEAGARFLRERGIADPFPYMAPDFDDPLPEDFLLKPLPESRPRKK
jgi:prevent-host-death family protein